MSLEGRRYLIVGASSDSDIGAAICRRLHSEGADLLLVGRRLSSLQTLNQSLGDAHSCISFDVTQSDQLQAWVAGLVEAYGVFDGMVYSASYQGYSPLRSIDSELFYRYFSVNTLAPLMLSAAISHRRHHRARSCSLVFISSAAGLRGQSARSLYASSKAALISLTQSLALELSSKRIRVNSVAPAVVNGRRAEQQLSLLSAEGAEQLLKAHPLGLPSPDSVANSVCFLLSDDSHHITGTALTVDGGYLAG